MRILSMLFALVLAFAATSFAQVKVGYVQVEALVQNFPEFEDAAKTYEKELQGWQTQLQEMQQAVNGLEEEYKQRQMLFSPEKKREKEEEIVTKRRDMAQFYQETFSEQGKAEQRKMELLTPVYAKINRAIEILGDRDKYTMIFNAQGLLYANETMDLTEEVLKILKAGVDVSPKAAGGTSSGSPRR